MLALTRKVGEFIDIAGGSIQIMIVEIKGDKVKVGISADKSIRVDRGEITDAIREGRIADMRAELDYRQNND